MNPQVMLSPMHRYPRASCDDTYSPKAPFYIDPHPGSFCADFFFNITYWGDMHCSSYVCNCRMSESGMCLKYSILFYDKGNFYKSRYIYGLKFK